MTVAAARAGGPSAARARFLADRVQTAGPASLLVMLYDRLVIDLDRAEQAQRSGDVPTAREALLHAQDIVAELLSTLDTQAWSGAAGLSSLYSFLLQELVRANVRQDADATAGCRRIAEPLRDAWRDAAVTTAGTVGEAVA